MSRSVTLKPAESVCITGLADAQDFIGWEQVDGHPPRFPDQPGLSALGDQLGLDQSLLRFMASRALAEGKSQRRVAAEE